MSPAFESGEVDGSPPCGAQNSGAQSFGLYIHVPFCSRKCPYCDFNTYAVKDVPEQQYVDGLLREMELYALESSFAGKEVHSVFWGGGTPSLFSPKSIARVLERSEALFGLRSNAEVTLEANPAAAQETLYSGYRTAGINRISLGAQSFSQKVLSFLGREHTPVQVDNAVIAAIRAGIENVSVDLIFGVPNQEVNDVEQDVAIALSLPISHLSTYSLTIEKGTPFFQRQERGLLCMPHEDVVVRMMERIPEILDQNGFVRYEISNYSRPGKESFHNTAYWRGCNYLGLGAGAHSYVELDEHVDLGENALKARRWSNCALPADYLKRVDVGNAQAWQENLTRRMLQFEFFFLGLRLIRGVELSEYSTKFKEDARVRFGGVIEDLVTSRHLILNGSRLALSASGMLIADTIVEQFAQ